MAGQHHAPMSAGIDNSRLAMEIHSAFFSAAASASEGAAATGTSAFPSWLILQDQLSALDLPAASAAFFVREDPINSQISEHHAESKINVENLVYSL